MFDERRAEQRRHSLREQHKSRHQGAGWPEGIIVDLIEARGGNMSKDKHILLIERQG